jgi:DNA-binding NarL/FixJ family response regulator
VIRVLVADNSNIHTQALAGALTYDAGLHVIPFDSDPASLVAVAAADRIDVLVISAGGGNDPGRGLTAVRQLHEALPRVRMIVMLDSSRPEIVLESFRSGARGLIGRDESVSVLCKCIHRVYQGQIWANTLQMSLAVEALAAVPNVRAVDAHGMDILSKRELEVVSGVAEGLTNREIAQRLGLSQHTVKNHLFCIFDKLGVSSRIELLLMTLSNPSCLPPLLGEPALGQPALGEPANETQEIDRTAPTNGKGVPHRRVALQ